MSQENMDDTKRQAMSVSIVIVNALAAGFIVYAFMTEAWVRIDKKLKALRESELPSTDVSLAEINPVAAVDLVQADEDAKGLQEVGVESDVCGDDV